MFIDYAEIEIRSGDGGNGAVTFRREKYVPKGGPSGGNGGKGGNVIIRSSKNLNTLLDFKYKRRYFAGNADAGASALKDGKNGEDVIIKVPFGTTVKDFATGEILYDFHDNSHEYIVAKGGRGGKGNSNFATSTNQAPRYAEQGRPGIEMKLILELKLIADVGLVGFPNAGKSTLISTISAAKPKIADYPFTTLEPILGIVRYKNFKSFTVADIPGIIEGASDGKGLGLKFLRHIERTKILLFMIDSLSEDINKDYKTLLKELKKYSPTLAEKKKIIGISKADLLDEDLLKKLQKKKSINNTEVILFSSATNYNIQQLIDKLWSMIKVKE